MTCELWGEYVEGREVHVLPRKYMAHTDLGILCAQSYNMTVGTTARSEWLCGCTARMAYCTHA